MALIPNTYTDDTKTHSHLLLEMYDMSQLGAATINWAGIVKGKINTYLGRTTDFSASELAETKNEGIIEAASQLTAAYIEANPQEKMPQLTEEAKKDNDEAYAMLDQWMKWKGIKPQSFTRITEIPIIVAEAGTYDA